LSAYCRNFSWVAAHLRLVEVDLVLLVVLDATIAGVAVSLPLVWADVVAYVSGLSVLDE